MLKIGDFAHIAQVSVRLLHYYDQIGLLHPVYADQVTGYRYYSIEQLPRLYRILALKDLGLSLDQITYLLDEAVTIEEIRGILLLKRAELRQRVNEEQARLTRVETRLNNLEQTNDLPECEVVFKRVDPLPVLSIRRALAPGEQPISLFHEVTDVLQESGLQQYIEGVLGLYYGGYIRLTYPEIKPRRFLMEAAYLIDTAKITRLPAINGRQMKQRTLPGFELVATTIHCGPDAIRHLAFQAMFRWIETSRYRLIAPTREIYLRRGETPEEHITEIQFPVEKVEVVPIEGSS
jgi:DNA-binding transcriptional MerR regulator